MVTRVLDGDTIQCDMLIRGRTYSVRVRLFHVGAPEIKTRDSVEKEHAFKCKEHLSNLILGKRILVECHGMDKYGRTIGTVFMRGENINNAMILDTVCVEWNGRGKCVYDWSKPTRYKVPT